MPTLTTSFLSTFIVAGLVEKRGGKSNNYWNYFGWYLLKWLLFPGETDSKWKQFKLLGSLSVTHRRGSEQTQWSQPKVSIPYTICIICIQRWVSLKSARGTLEMLYQYRVSVHLISLKLNSFQTSTYQDQDCHHLQQQKLHILPLFHYSSQRCQVASYRNIWWHQQYTGLIISPICIYISEQIGRHQSMALKKLVTNIQQHIFHLESCFKIG